MWNMEATTTVQRATTKENNPMNQATSGSTDYTLYHSPELDHATSSEHEVQLVEILPHSILRGANPTSPPISVREEVKILTSQQDVKPSDEQ
ncbi:hypothetical protein JD844_014447 [Phrynosoma platyrhinos]|uniref:Uncharacterized protein n=1 Tax=Phrynosoma platyrhinos TaxID=52577 RepID=A0ABQ7SRL1_PHRPL|nr:hypothetical protein JD844_014447 [Phrynosoma platyrhinos]